MTVAMNVSLESNIQFDSGGGNTLLLENDLQLSDGVTIVNNGTIDVNGKRLAFGGEPLTLERIFDAPICSKTSSAFSARYLPIFKSWS